MFRFLCLFLCICFSVFAEQEVNRPMDDFRSCIARRTNLLESASRITFTEFNNILGKVLSKKPLSKAELNKLMPKIDHLLSEFDAFLISSKKYEAKNAREVEFLKVLKDRAFHLKKVREYLEKGYSTPYVHTQLRQAFSLLYPDYWLREKTNGKLIRHLEISLNRYRAPTKLTRNEIIAISGNTSSKARYIGNIKHNGQYYAAEILEDNPATKVVLQRVHLNKKMPVYHSQIVVSFERPIKFYSQRNPGEYIMMNDLLISSYAARANGVKYSPTKGLYTKDYALVNMIETRIVNNTQYIEKENLRIDDIPVKIDAKKAVELLFHTVKRARSLKGEKTYNTLLKSCHTELFLLLDEVAGIKMRYPRLPVLFEVQLMLRGLLK